MLRFVYNILFPVCFCLGVPRYFLKLWRRGNWREGFGQRFGRYDPKFKARLADRKTLWIHAVSVGEARVCLQLIESLRPRLPDTTFVVSTTTSTGMGVLRRELPQGVEAIYYPVDGRACVRRALDAVHPAGIILVEAEVWPNLVWEAERRGIPLFLVNARLSERSFRGYRRAGFLFRKLFAAFDGVCAQDEIDAGRLERIGYRPEVIEVVGSMKFDAGKYEPQPGGLDVGALLERVGVSPDSIVLVGGSTHSGEELVLMRIARRLKERFPAFFPVIVPRHFERARAIVSELKSAGFRIARRSELDGNAPGSGDRPDGLLVDSTGELRAFYERADMVFVGKSLRARGGQNPIEPAVQGCAVVFGPNMQNFERIASRFVEGGGAIQVADERELEAAIEGLLRQPEKRKELGERAQAVFRDNLGATGRTVETIVSRLAEIEKRNAGRG